MTTAHPYDWTSDSPPIGTWRTVEGSFSDVMGCVLTISEDGTGTAEYYEGETTVRTEPFLWQFNEQSVLRLYLTDEECPLPEVETDWEVIRYKTDWHKADTGERPVLVNATRQSEWTTEERFWTLTGPMHLIARAE